MSPTFTGEPCVGYIIRMLMGESCVVYIHAWARLPPKAQTAQTDPLAGNTLQPGTCPIPVLGFGVKTTMLYAGTVVFHH